ncbi:GGDEF domain-containing protein [Colwellia sp. 75C3]|uniref:GGDEF domain-containing protein n=1 Tax=Colwellia sp. 75C3 TaxID=888425 RepID=UPI0012FEBD23|nr:GGDEF domain-containing protein [Colwellia sp. 75C3]
MIEHIIRNLDLETSKELATTIKAMLSDHIRFIREINQILIFKNSKNVVLNHSKLPLHNNFFRSFIGEEFKNNDDMNKIEALHNQLQSIAVLLSSQFKDTGKIDIDHYENFLAQNDMFFELLWKLATEVISAQYQFDPLTKLLNRRAFQPILIHELSRVNRKETKTSLVLIDLDNFKEVNDTFGHDTGDQILREFSDVLRASIRESDCASRHGGEEFLLCLPDTDMETAQPVIERLSKLISDNEYSEKIKVTASFGIALLNGDTKQSIINADKAMYQSKANGKNQVSLFK